MKIIIYSLHLIMSIGGGLLGFLTFSNLTDFDGGIEIAIVLAFATFYVVGIISGVKFSLNPDSKGLLKLYYILQIPLFTSKVFGYQFFSGLGLYTGINLFQTESSVFTIGFHFEYPSKWIFSLNDGLPFTFGVNIVACLLLLLLCKINYSNQSLEQTRDNA